MKGLWNAGEGYDPAGGVIAAAELGSLVSWVSSTGGEGIKGVTAAIQE